MRANFRYVLLDQFLVKGFFIRTLSKKVKCIPNVNIMENFNFKHFKVAFCEHAKSIKR